MLRLVALAALAALLGGCTHERLGPVTGHFADFAAREPHGNTVHVCHAYGCKMQTRFRFTDEDVATLGNLMETTRKADSAPEERRAIAYAIAWMETRTGDVIGHQRRPAGHGFRGLRRPDATGLRR